MHVLRWFSVVAIANTLILCSHARLLVAVGVLLNGAVLLTMVWVLVAARHARRSAPPAA